MTLLPLQRGFERLMDGAYGLRLTGIFGQGVKLPNHFTFQHGLRRNSLIRAVQFHF